jgi:hypothetical protein
MLEADIAKSACHRHARGRPVQLDWAAHASRHPAPAHHAPGIPDSASTHATWRGPARWQRIDAHGWAATAKCAPASTPSGSASLRRSRPVGTCGKAAERCRAARHATPDLTRIDLTASRSPGRRAYFEELGRRPPAGRHAGRRVDVAAPSKGPLRISGRLQARAGQGSETTDASIATDHLGGTFDFDYRIVDAHALRCSRWMAR